MINKYGTPEQYPRITLERERFRPDWKQGQVVTQLVSTSYTPIYDKGKVNFCFC